LEDARRVVAAFVTEYNEVRLHSAIGYITLHDMLSGRQAVIQAQRDAKLEAARIKRAAARQQQRSHHNESKAIDKSSKPLSASYTKDIRSEDKALLGSNLSAAPMLLASGGGDLQT